MLLTITEIGYQRETDALASGYFPRVEAVVVGDGAPLADPTTATRLVHEIARVPVVAVERVSAQAVRFHASIPQGETLTIRELGLVLEDGALYGYLPYETLIGAPLHKHASFAFSFSLAVAREPLPPIEVKYSPLDTSKITETIGLQIQLRVDELVAEVTGATDNGLSAIAVEISRAVNDVGTAKSDALSQIGTAKSDALSQIGTAKSDALSQIGTAKSDALSQIGTAKSDALSQIDSIIANKLNVVNEAIERFRPLSARSYFLWGR